MRIALVAEAPIGRGLAHASGFAPRYAALLEALVQEHEVRIVYLERDASGFRESTDALDRIAEVVEIPVPTPRRTRLERWERTGRILLGRVGNRPWEKKLERVLDGWQPDVAMTLCWDNRAMFTSVPARFPTISFVEEDISVIRPRKTTTRRGRASTFATQWVEDRAVGRSRVVVVISERELAWARRTFPRSSTLVVPHVIDERYWCEEVDQPPPLTDEDVLVVGQMGHARNARGLRDVLVALRSTNRRGRRSVAVASTSGVHRILDDVADEFRFLGAVDDLRPYYRSAGAALVPSFIVSGAKTAILQGWATRCPVVTTSAAADSVRARDRREVVAGSTPAAVASRLCDLLDDPELASSIVQEGARALAERHNEQAMRAAVTEALRLATEGPPRRPRNGIGRRR